ITPVFSLRYTRAHTRTLPAQWPGGLTEALGKGEFFHLPPPGRRAWSQVSRPHCWLPPFCTCSSYKGPTPGGYLVECVVSAPACPCHNHRPCFCNNDDPGLSHLLKRKSQSVAVASYFN
uniref:Uncharacterized protein n=1 Tax=Theropithecus gelada TaxID=9565 RepID=A0A8D2FDS3_THEGE